MFYSTLQDVAPFSLSNGKNLHLNSEHLGAQRLRSSIEHLHEEVFIFLKLMLKVVCIAQNSQLFLLQLEKMKNENAVFSIGHDGNSDFPVTHKEFMQLQKVS